MPNLTLSICAAAVLSQASVALPPLDCDGRYPTHNKHGFCDPHFNETQKAFIRRAIRRSKGDSSDRLPMVMEIGGGYTPVGPGIVARGGNYLYVDMEQVHAEVAEELLANAQVCDSQSRVLVGKYPESWTGDRKFRTDLLEIRNDYTITDIGIFSALMYFSGEETVQFLKWAYHILPVGGRVYLTGASAYGNAFPGFESEYEKRLSVFLASGGKQMPFPGWIPDLKDPSFNAYVPPGFLNSYPAHFHILDYRVLEVYAKEVGFKIVKGKFLRRPGPERYRYNGPRKDVGELSSLIIEKPRPMDGSI